MALGAARGSRAATREVGLEVREGERDACGAAVDYRAYRGAVRLAEYFHAEESSEAVHGASMTNAWISARGIASMRTEPMASGIAIKMSARGASCRLKWPPR